MFTLEQKKNKNMIKSEKEENWINILYNVLELITYDARSMLHCLDILEEMLKETDKTSLTNL